MAKERVYKGDTAVIDVFLFEDDDISPLPATGIEWVVKAPDGNTDTGVDVTLDAADYTIATDFTQLPGSYSVQATFTLSDGKKKSVISTYEVIDPLQMSSENETESDQEKVVDRAWMKLEDLFDSDLGGPHVQDRTQALFSREKIGRLLPDAVYGINQSYQPATSYTEISFPYNQHAPLLSQALLVESIYHLMRSYVEQPLPQGQLSYFDRRDYLTRWKMILDGESTKLDRWLDLFKLDQLDFGATSSLVGGYSGWVGRAPRYMRGRYPFIVRW